VFQDSEIQMLIFIEHVHALKTQFKQIKSTIYFNQRSCSKTIKFNL